MKKQLEATPRPIIPTSSCSETVCSRDLVVSISQMTLGAAPPLAVSAVPRLAAVPTLLAVAPPLRATVMPAGVTDTATTVAHSSAQLATGHPYATHPPAPGFLYPPAGYLPYWGMYPYKYPQYPAPLPSVHPGRGVPPMVAPLSLPVPEPQSAPMMVDPSVHQKPKITVSSSMLPGA